MSGSNFYLSLKVCPISHFSSLINTVQVLIPVTLKHLAVAKQWIMAVSHLKAGKQSSLKVGSCFCGLHLGKCGCFFYTCMDWTAFSFKLQKELDEPVSLLDTQVQTAALLRYRGVCVSFSTSL